MSRLLLQWARTCLILILPLAGLAWLWHQTDVRSREGTEWEAPVYGVAPRDPIYGHYIEFFFEWPMSTAKNSKGGATDASSPRVLNYLCIVGDPPTITTVVEFDDPDDHVFEQCAHKLIVQPHSTYGKESLLRGRLYISQDRAAQLKSRLRDTHHRGFIRFRQHGDGALTPLDIRFQPLSPEERARDEDMSRVR